MNRLGRIAAAVTTTNIFEDRPFDRYTTEMIEALRAAYALEDVFDLGPDGQIYYLYRLRKASERPK